MFPSFLFHIYDANETQLVRLAIALWLFPSVFFSSCKTNCCSFCAQQMNSNLKFYFTRPTATNCFSPNLSSILWPSQLMQMPWPRWSYGSDVTASVLLPSRKRVGVMSVCWRRWEENACENGRVGAVGSARVPRVPGAAGCLGQGPPLSAHLLPPLPPGHPGDRKSVV